MSFLSRLSAGCTAATGGLIFLVVGVGMLAVGGWSYFNTRHQMATWGQTEGEIVSFRYYDDGEGTSTVPVIEFTTADGHTLTAEPYAERNTTVDVDGYRVGDRVEVFYNPENPRDMFINDFMHVWFLPTLMGGMGTLFGAIGGVWSVSVLAGAVLARGGQPLRPRATAADAGSGPPIVKI